MTRRDLRVFSEEDAIGELFERLVREALAIAAASGTPFDAREVDAAAWRRAARPLHKPSMLVDLEQGRPLELDAFLRRPQAVARACGIETPVLDTVLALLACASRTGPTPA